VQEAGIDVLLFLKTRLFSKKLTKVTRQPFAPSRAQWCVTSTTARAHPLMPGAVSGIHRHGETRNGSFESWERAAVDVVNYSDVWTMQGR